MTESRLTAARRRLRAWRDKRAEEKAAPHRDTQRRMLWALNGSGRAKQIAGRSVPVTKHHVYAGTANRNAVAKRRRKAKMARESRRINRKG